MASQITRRDFLKVSGMATGLLLVSGCTVDLQEPVWMESYNRAPEFTLPGEDLWFASTCRMCPAGCGTITRVSNGRARKIEGNPEHPLNRGKLCARGQAGLQELYHPDRVQQIMIRAGDRGQGQWSTTDWERVISDLATQIQDVDPGRVAFLAGFLPDYQMTIVNRFLDGLGAPPAVVYDTQSALDGRIVLETANQSLFGEAALPIYDIANAEVVYGFGANFLETWLSPVAYSQAFGMLRGRSVTRGALVAFEPRLSMTAASADQWMPVAPGTEGLVALALGKIIVDEGLGHDNPHVEHQSLYANADISVIAKSAQIDTERLVHFARLFADSDHPIAVPGSFLTGYSNGLDAVKAVQALNIVVENPGTHGGLFLSSKAPTRDLRPTPLNSFAEVQTLVERMRSDEIDILFVLGANPRYDLPAAVGFDQALANVAQVICCATLLDETAAHADTVLPAHTYMETWGYQFINPGSDKATVGAQQPVVRPLYDSRDPADVLMALADKLGGNVAQRIPWPNLANFIQTRLTSLQLLDGNLATDNPETFWTGWLQHGGWWSQETTWVAPQVDEAALAAPLVGTIPTFAGDEASYPFHLLPLPSSAFGDGRHAGLPWLQEMPDPMTTAAWDTWVEINPATAERLGIDNNELVLIESPAGAIRAIVYTFPGIHPETVAVPIGQGHTELGRWARNRGDNVLKILVPQMEANTGQLAWAATRVRISKTGEQRSLPLLESNVGVDRFRRREL